MGIVDDMFKLADYNERLYKIQPQCPECHTKQVQIIDTRTQDWKCRHCGDEFQTYEDIGSWK